MKEGNNSNYGIKDLEITERPRERLAKMGAGVLSTADLLDISVFIWLPTFYFTIQIKKGGVKHILHINTDDVAITKAIISAGKLLDIQVLGHLIIGQGRFISRNRRGLGFSED